MNIILLGYRGSGKSTIGKLLADQLWKNFVDLDDLVCGRFGDKTIREIWLEHGEAAFRELESIVLVEVLEKDEQVVSLGGGTAMSPDARRAVEQAGDAVRIYLKCEAQVLCDRVRGDEQRTGTRPSSIGEANSLPQIEAALAQREPVYEQVADKVLDVTHLGPEAAVRYLIARCL